MSENHAWRSGGNVPAAQIGLVVFLAGVLSTSALATTRQAIPDPVVFAQSESEPLPAIPGDGALVDISPQLDAAPEIFDGKAKAVWDGRGTLRGVWVAHPLAKMAHRVRIYNLENGAVVDGAMFKREAIAGNERVIVSSDAAEKLGLAPNTAARLRIVGVRPAAGSAKKTDDAGTADTGGSQANGKTADAAAVDAPGLTVTEAAGDDALNGASGAKAAPEDTATSPTNDTAAKADGDGSATGTSEVADTPTVPAADAAPLKPVADAAGISDLPPIPKARPSGPTDTTAASDLSERALDVMAATRAAAGFKFVPDGENDTRLADVAGFFTRAPAADGPAGKTSADALTTDAALLTEPRRKDGDGANAVTPAADDAAPAAPAASRLPNDPGTPLMLKADSKTPAFKIAPASADVSDATGGTDDNADNVPDVEAEIAVAPVEPPATGEKTAKTDDAEGDVSSAAAPASEDAPTGPGLEQPYVQVGLFGIPENAEKLVDELKTRGIPAVVRPFEAGGKAFSRVLVGPFGDEVARDRVQKMVRDLGLTDAMPVKG